MSPCAVWIRATAEGGASTVTTIPAGTVFFTPPRVGLSGWFSKAAVLMDSFQRAPSSMPSSPKNLHGSTRSTFPSFNATEPE